MMLSKAGLAVRNGCTVGFHSNVKPLEPEKQQQQKCQQEPMYQVQAEPIHKPLTTIIKTRPSDEESMLDLKANIGASLRTHLEKLNLNSSESSALVEDGEVKIGTSCNNRGCKSSYQGEDSHTEKCAFHPGVPVFHEGMKFWSCCQRKTSDFDAFLNQEGCDVGTHVWHKTKASEEKQVRVDWHQTPTTVCISIFAKNAQPDKVQVQANQVKCQVSLVYDDGSSTYNKTFLLREAIIPSSSEVRLLATKVEIVMKKYESFSWSTLEYPVNNILS
uniref:CS domain-containing protein n=1 Tax=Arion vulgaris TaxID=1028688 RepID=A0A0B7A2J9_9EUPU